MPRGQHPLAGFLQPFNPHDMPPIMNQHNAPIGVLHSHQEAFSSNMPQPSYPFLPPSETRNLPFDNSSRPPPLFHPVPPPPPPNPVNSAPDLVLNNNGYRFIMMRDPSGVAYHPAHHPYSPPPMQMYPELPHLNPLAADMNAPTRSQQPFLNRSNTVFPPNERVATNENISQTYLFPTYPNSPQYRPHPPPNSSFPRCNNSLNSSEYPASYPYQYEAPYPSTHSRQPSNSQSFHHHHPPLPPHSQQASPSDSSEAIYFLPDFLNQEINNVPQGFAAPQQELIAEERHQPSSSSHFNPPPVFSSSHYQHVQQANQMRDFLRANPDYAARLGAQHPQPQPSSHHQGPSSGNPLSIFQATPESLEFWRPGYRQSAMNNMNRGPACPTHAPFLSRYVPPPSWLDRDRLQHFSSVPLNTYIERLIQRDIDTIFRTSHHGNLSRQSESEAREELSRFLTELKGTENEDCCICTDNGESLWNLPCNHSFHKECLLKWLVNRRTCPLCRTVY